MRVEECAPSRALVLLRRPTLLENFVRCHRKVRQGIFSIRITFGLLLVRQRWCTAKSGRRTLVPAHLIAVPVGSLICPTPCTGVRLLAYERLLCTCVLFVHFRADRARCSGCKGPKGPWSGELPSGRMDSLREGTLVSRVTGAPAAPSAEVPNTSCRPEASTNRAKNKHALRRHCALKDSNPKMVSLRR